jgi:hypothetical protein
MPSKKQRRRRQKTFRHEYGFVTYDEEGNEIEVDSTAVRTEKKPSKPKAAASSNGKSGRVLRPAEPPSWQRSLRKGGLWGLGMLAVAIFFFKGMPLPQRLMLGILYAAAFIPLTYWIDRTTYRSYLKRSGKTPPAKPSS